MSSIDLGGISAGVAVNPTGRPRSPAARANGSQLRPHTRLAVSLCNIGIALSMVLGMSASNADEPMPAPRCAVRLSVAVTPDVPDPSNGGFLSSLLGDHAEYQLFLLSRDDDTHVTLQLQGPGPAERCHAVVDSMRNDGRVQSIQVN
jgi:hypothetical protein